MRLLTMLLAASVLPVVCKSGTESPTVQRRMKDHEKVAAAIRDAVARGDVDDAKREATALALLPVDGPTAIAWRQKLDAMDLAAGHVASAVDLKDAAHALGPLAQTCGDCHAIVGRSSPVVGEPAGQASGVRPYMIRHEWAARQMWDGLAIPSDDAWKAGAHALSDEPLTPEVLTPGKTPVPKVGALEESVHDLGRRAEATGPVSARVALYGDVMATCGECHQWLGGGPDAGWLR